MALNIKGVDISYCQSGLNYKKLVEDGIEFAIIRAGATGTESHKQFEDSLLNRHVNGCIGENIDYGFYYYSVATSVEEAKKEAQFAVETVKKYPLPKYPLFWDGEDMQIAAKGKKVATDIAIAFMDEVERLGYPSGIYCNPSWMECYLDKNRIINHKDIWLAHWVSESSYHYGQKMWQNGLMYSSGMKIDSDICFINYPKETANWYKKHGIEYNKPSKKSMDEIIDEVWRGVWGCGQQRYDDLTAAGYDYYEIQDEINRRLKAEAEKSTETIKVGSKVMVKKGAKTYNGGYLAEFVSNRAHTVTELVGDRAVINYGDVVVAAVNVKDLTLA